MDYKIRIIIWDKELDVEQSISSPDMVFENGYMNYYHGDGNEWHRTYESAIEKAEAMRQKRIKSLEKQIEKLEKMRFV